MNTIFALVLLVGLLGSVLVALQWNHHRAAGWPRSPYGGEPDGDLRRIWLDLMAGRH